MTTKNAKEQSEKSPGLKCFVITPVGDPNSEIRTETNGIIEAVIKPLLEPEYTVSAAHLSMSSVIITKEIIQEIYDANLIIANLTDSNPNVMYELSLAHALRKPVVHLIREGQKPPFDISVQRYISYTNNMLGTVHLSAQLRKFVDDVTAKGKKVSNPITDTIDTIQITPETREVEIVEALNDLNNRFASLERDLSMKISHNSRVLKDTRSSRNEYEEVNDYINLLFKKMRIDSDERFEQYKRRMVAEVRSMFGYDEVLSEKAVVWNYENRSSPLNTRYRSSDKAEV
ncbi:MAG: hypothetical protein FD179_996 [Erysipelotrichaceae bacterium]|nr:MAG: hypothetical protein FD179_996 [Erysipelotrichaceae bacterium]